MSIRLVSDGGGVFWFTQTNWDALLRFAEACGWERSGKLLPDQWDESLQWNEHWEIVGGEHLTAEASSALADAVNRGLADPDNRFLRDMIDHRRKRVEQAFPEHEWTTTVKDFVDEWTRFTSFARRGGFRIDLTD